MNVHVHVRTLSWVGGRGLTHAILRRHQNFGMTTACLRTYVPGEVDEVEDLVTCLWCLAGADAR